MDRALAHRFLGELGYERRRCRARRARARPARRGASRRSTRSRIGTPSTRRARAPADGRALETRVTREAFDALVAPIVRADRRRVPARASRRRAHARSARRGHPRRRRDAHARGAGVTSPSSSASEPLADIDPDQVVALGAAHPGRHARRRGAARRRAAARRAPAVARHRDDGRRRRADPPAQHGHPGRRRADLHDVRGQPDGLRAARGAGRARARRGLPVARALHAAGHPADGGRDGAARGDASRSTPTACSTSPRRSSARASSSASRSSRATGSPTNEIEKMLIDAYEHGEDDVQAAPPPRAARRGRRACFRRSKGRSSTTRRLLEPGEARHIRAGVARLRDALEASDDPRVIESRTEELDEISTRVRGPPHGPEHPRGAPRPRRRRGRGRDEGREGHRGAPSRGSG